MSNAIRVEVGSARVGYDLARALSVRGITARVIEVEGGIAVEVVSSERELTSRLLAETEQAVADWCLELGVAPFVVEVVERAPSPALSAQRVAA